MLFKTVENHSVNILYNVGKTTINHPQVITIFVGGINLPFHQSWVV
jgi:hypothetical protein